MKKIVGIDEELKTLAGEIFKYGEKNLTVKLALLNLIGVAKAKNGEEAIKIMDIGLRLKDAGKDFEFNEDEEAVIKEAINSNNPQYLASIIAPVYKKIKEAVAFKRVK